MATATAVWTGVIVVGTLELDCRLFSSLKKAELLSLRTVHKSCHTILDLRDEREKPAEPLPIQVPARVQTQPFCPKCQQRLNTDEIGKAIETPSGIFELSEEELTSLEFESTKRVQAELIQANDPVLETIGFGGRLYVMPKAGTLSEYANVWHVLYQSQRVGFISCLVIKKKPNVGIIKPLDIPETVFGKHYQVLVVDILNNTDCLKNPTELLDSFDALPPLDASKLAQSIAAAQNTKTELDPKHCGNPKQRRLKEIVRQKILTCSP